MPTILSSSTRSQTVTFCGDGMEKIFRKVREESTSSTRLTTTGVTIRQEELIHV